MGVRGNLYIFIDLGGGEPKTSISAENSAKIYFLALFADSHPALGCQTPDTLKNLQDLNT